MTIYNLGNSQLPIINDTYASYNDNTLMNKKEIKWGSSLLSDLYPLDTMILLWQNNLQKVEVAAVCYNSIFIETKTEKQSL